MTKYRKSSILKVEWESARARIPIKSRKVSENMISPTIVTIVGLSLAAVALIVLLIRVLKSMFRPVLRSGMQLLVALTCIPISLLLAKVACSVAVDKVLALIDLGDLQQILTDLPSGQAAVKGLVQILATPFVFVTIYFFLWILLGAIVGIVVRSLEKGGSKVALFKNKAIGAGIGAVCAVVLVVVYLMPLIGYTGIVGDVLKSDAMVTLRTDGELVDVLADEDMAAIDEIINTPALAIPRALGGKALFKAATTTRLDGEELSLTGEIEMVIDLVSVAIPVYNNMENLTEADVALVQETLPRVFEESTLLRVLGAEALSGFSNAWLKGEAFLTVEKPEQDGVIGIVIDSALTLFKDTTKDTIVSDIRGLTPALSAAMAVVKLQNGGDISDMLDALAACADSPELKSLIVTAGVGVLADTLGLYNDKEEIYTSYAEGLAALTPASLTEEQIHNEIVALNDKYAVTMTDDEVSALARALVTHPFDATLNQPTALAPATGYAVLAPIGLFQSTPVVSLSAQGDETIEAWMAVIAQAAAGDQESLAWLATKAEIPTSLVTTKDLTALTTREALADLGKEEMTALFSAAAEVLAGEGEIDLVNTIALVGDALSGFAKTESGKELVTTLVTGVLQSDTVCESMGITPGQATTIATVIKDSGSLENLGETAKDISNLVNVLGHLKGDAESAGGEVSPEDFHTLISTMNDSSAELLRSLCTAEMLGKMGLPETSTAGVAHLLDDLLDGLITARKNWTDEAYQKEADALYRVLQLAVGAKNGNGSTFTERFGMSPVQFVDTMLASELLTTVLPGSVNELYDETPDALGLSQTIGEEDRAELLAEIENCKQSTNEEGDALLDALARMLK